MKKEAKEKFVEASDNLLKAIEAYELAHKEAFKEGIENFKNHQGEMQTLEDCLKNYPIDREFKPKLVYQTSGDFLWYYWKDAADYTEWYGRVDLCRDMDTKEVIGIKVRGILHMLKEHVKENRNDSFSFLKVCDAIDPRGLEGKREVEEGQ